MAPNTSAVLVSAGVTATVGAVGALVLWRLTRGRPRTAAFAAPLVVVVALAAGIASATRSMLIHETDYRTMLFVLLAGAPVALVVGLLLARRIAAAEQAMAHERAASAQALALEASRRETITWLGHDLRTPLTGVRLLAEGVADGVGEPRIAANRIVREVDRLDAMVDDLTMLTRLQTPGALTLDEVDLDDLVSDAVASVSPLAEDLGVVVVSDGLAGGVLQANPSQVGRAVTNLVRNAVQHTPGGEVVRVGTRARVVIVQDGCGGIREEDLPHLATAGWRGDGARSGGGMGLGLTITSEVARAHGGTLTIANAADGSGCIATLTL